MKQERNLPAVPHGLVAANSPAVSPLSIPNSPAQPLFRSPLSIPNSPAQPLFQTPTPSPYSFSVASTRLATRPPEHLFNLLLRSLAVLLSFVAAISLAAPSSRRGKGTEIFYYHTELLYSFVVYVLTFFYSAFQLFKGVCDIGYRGILISDKTSDYTSFIFDQLAAYLVISSSSVAAIAIQHMRTNAPLWKASRIAVGMSFPTFVVIAISALLSGYKLCKRIIW
ncbi:CASP-like protein 4A4 [Ipomoea triloba]|uniref:CASP-like protein 4A4 n=1 Tax=Ipomoea triloba TaxID=35885 RepID=UPI00125CE67D|nr:CASP-like protein 4A4 [Ipomoea triloba]GLL45160.1 CASP-like protein 4A4 [Ipomoea trifida]